MNRITIAIIIAVVLACLPAWAGTWKDNFDGDFLWVKRDTDPAAEPTTWEIKNGELMASGKGFFFEIPIREDGKVKEWGMLPAAPWAVGWIFPSQAPMEITEQDIIVAEVKLKVVRRRIRIV